MPWIQSQFQLKNGILTHFLHSSSPSPSAHDSGYQKQAANPPPASSSGTKISPLIPFIIVVLAVIFFVCGLVHLLVRYVIKKRSSPSSVSESNRNRELSGSDAFQRQLQQLFHLHDSGLDQAFIDALPVFLYKEIMGLKEPFDCAVCLCEFLEDDKLRLLPMCTHAFHIDCIDTWLLSNSTCPLCRGTIFTPGFPIENPVFDFEDMMREEERFSGTGGSGVSDNKPTENEILIGKRVFSVRLGKFRSITNEESIGRTGIERGEGETSTSTSSNLDTRRCYSMGSYQYVVAESDLLVALCPSGVGVNMVGRGGENGNSSMDGDNNADGKKVNMRSKGESFSVSKIWQWSNKNGRFPNPSETHSSSSFAVGLSRNGGKAQVP